MRTLRALVALAIVAAAGWYGWTHRQQLLERLTPRTAPDAPRPAGEPVADEAEPTDAPDPIVGGRPAFDPAGTELAITLLYPPVREYLDAAVDTEDEYRSLVEATAGGRVVYDPHLSRAAREVAYQVGVLGGPPPEAMLSFLIHSSGAPELTTKEWFLHTNDESSAALREMIERAIRSPVRGRGTIRLGVGEVSTPGERHTRHIAVLLTRREFAIEPTPRVAPPDSEWILRGTLPPAFRNAASTVMWPDGSIGALEVDSRGNGFELVVPTKSTRGTMYVSMGGTGASGPGKLLQLTVEVGDAPPRTLRTFIPAADPEFASVADAEAYALGLLNDDRARFGLARLELDPALSRIARAHSDDMRDRKFFGHLSPATGLPSDRLAAADYRARTHSENVALNDTLGESQHALMASIGHRRNVLDPRFTHVGIGVASKTNRGGRTQFHLTQLFATPVETVESDAAAAAVLARINTERAQRGVRALHTDADLASIAYRGASDASNGPLDGIPRRTAKRVQQVTSRGAGVSVQAVFAMEQVSIPDVAVEHDMQSIGIGVVQSPTHTQGRIGIVLIVAP